MISLITLTHNKLPVTSRCLPTWLETRGVDWELIVVDNGSTDGTPDWLETFRAGAGARGVETTILRNPANIGCSTARNRGIAAARGRLVAFLDNDVSLRRRDWLARLREALDSDPRCAMVGPKLLYPFSPYRIQCAGVGISRSGRVQFRGRGEARDEPRWNRREDVQCMISACCLARTEDVRAVGGFDEAFNPVQYEDFDLCYKLRERGGALRYIPEVEIYHLESVTTAGTPTMVNAENVIRNGLLFKKRWRHMFANESGPPDSDTKWARIDIPPLESIAEPPIF